MGYCTIIVATDQEEACSNASVIGDIIDNAIWKLVGKQVVARRSWIHLVT